MADLKFRVSAHSENPTKTVVKARGFEIIIDEPADLGGTNAGANPVEYILAAFCGCVNVMAHVVAKEMSIELRSLKIKMAGNLNPNRLFGTSFDERAGYKGIDVAVMPDCDASEEQLAKWLEAIEDRCPVSDNLRNITPVNLKLKLKKATVA
ncbi:osmotically inducible protein C [Labilibaculum filiforme]|uniref:Osmotically inducible protein C n=1 Tax=Labilibaculum filiforme TaxID=1940526 RepID=A0A2N3I5Z7_9BACT|nr:OsmC family protein [Labilibaculum filiforme]PKQ65744.1 osmotically inducible protein C [Labilibaculum filiforme]